MKGDSSLQKDKPELIKKQLAEVAVNGRIKCADAFRIAESLGVSPDVVGEMADDLNIKISNCRLGCF